MSSRFRVFAVAALALFAAVALAACGSGSHAAKTSAAVTTSGNGSASKSGGTSQPEVETAPTDPTRGAVACLRAHGIEPSAETGGALKRPNGMSTADFDSILTACAHKAVKLKTTPPPAQSGKPDSGVSALSACLREHGAISDGKLDQAKLADAEHACHSLLALGGAHLVKVKAGQLELGKIKLGKIKLGKINLGKLHIGKIHIGKIKVKKLENLGTGNSSANPPAS